MISKIKLFALTAFLSITGICSAQVFTIAEINNLVSQNADEFKKIVTEKGYTTENIVTGNGAMTQDYEYSNSLGSKISLICPTFSTGTKMVSWEFKTPGIYDAIKDDLIRNGYTLKNTERRNAGKYIAHYYSKPGSDIVLSCDKRIYPYGVYILSDRYSNPTSYIKKKSN